MRGFWIGLSLVLCPPLGLILLAVALMAPPGPPEVSPGAEPTPDGTHIAASPETISPGSRLSQDWGSIDAYITRVAAPEVWSHPGNRQSPL